MCSDKMIMVWEGQEIDKLLVKWKMDLTAISIQHSISVKKKFFTYFSCEHLDINLEV